MLPARARLTAAATIALLASGALVTAAPAGAAALKSTRTTVAAAAPVAGRPVTLQARVSPRPGGGVVRFSVAGRTLAGCGARPLSAGVASCRATFPSTGTRIVAATYSGRAKIYRSSIGRRAITVKAPTIVGSTGSCTTTTGALVAVSFGAWGGAVVRGCDTTPTTGADLLKTARFTTTPVQRQPAFICRIGHPLFKSGTRYPTADKCVNTPSSSAYWSYWVAAKGATTWKYAASSAAGQKATAGSVQAWTFGRTDVSGAGGKPVFTPAQVRKGLPSASAMRSAQRRATAAAPATANASAAADYLVGRLVGGTHYDTEGMPGTPDYGLTVDAALALAAAGGHDAVVDDIVDYLATRVNAYTFVKSPPGDAGRAAKLALLAEVTGRNPRAFGGVNLIAAVRSLQCTRATSDCAGRGAYRGVTSTFGQALAVLALQRAGVDAGVPAAFLESLQTATGGVGSNTDGSVVDVDSTALGAMALALVPGTRARDSVTSALRWIADRQRAGGGFTGASGTSVNSTALAVQALSLDARRYASAIATGQQFLAAAQNGDGGFDKALGDNGSDVRASAQALSGVARVPFGSVLDDLGSRTDAGAGADFVVSQLVDANHLTSSYVDENGDTQVYDDQGLTADGVFALLAAGGHDQTVAAMVTWLEGQIDAYADPNGGKEQYRGPYSGGLAKLALVALATGRDPHAFNGVDLLKVLRDNVCTAATTDATQCSAKGDFFQAYSGITQALGVLALNASTRASDHVAFTSPVVVRLRQLQCADGGFSSELPTKASDCTSDVDATGFAIQALSTVPGADAALGKAQHFLETRQRTGGVFAGAAGENSNSTALAAVGLQSLVTALHSSTVPQAGPRTIAPITRWQAALRGLATFALPNSGYAVSRGSADADVRSTTQAVLAAAQRTLVSLTGATILAVPRDAVVVQPPNPAPTPTPTPSAPTSGSAAPAKGAATEVADTGVTSDAQLAWALALLLVGAGCLALGRRRTATRER
ncbi:Ig-like domain repeat protein [Jatrophihabitans fulvus]